jgi:hypothetical protein
MINACKIVVVKPEGNGRKWKGENGSERNKIVEEHEIFVPVS